MKRLYSLTSTLTSDGIEHDFGGKINVNANSQEPHFEPFGKSRCELTKETERFTKSVLERGGINKVIVIYETEENGTNPIKRICNNFYTFVTKYFSGLRLG